MDLSRKRDRDRLKARREPYWQRMSGGRYLGFRRGPDTWVARLRDRSGKQHYSALDAESFDDAKQSAERWFEQLGTAPVRSAVRGTVSDAVNAYCEHLRQEGRADTAKVADQRFRLIVHPDPIGEIRLTDLTRQDMLAWRGRLMEGRQPRSVNRHVSGVAAALNRALREGFAGDPEAWRLDRLPDPTEDEGAAVFLDPQHRKALQDAASPPAADFMRALELTGARPKEIAAATASDLDNATGTLTLRHKKGRPARVRTRAVVLSPVALKFFSAHARGKLPGAPLLTDAQSRAWERHEWATEFRLAASAVNARAKGAKRIPVGASMYALRHSRIAELLQIHGIDPLTVAQQTGTSVRMIERHYFKFIAGALRDRLAALEELS